MEKLDTTGRQRELAGKVLVVLVMDEAAGHRLDHGRASRPWRGGRLFHPSAAVIVRGAPKESPKYCPENHALD
jgi:hypothetical protein